MDMMADWVALSFVSLGVVMFAVAYYVHRQATKLRKTITRLYELNYQVQQDALHFFEQAWPILHQAGIKQLRAKIEWFGEYRIENYGRSDSIHLEQSYEVKTQDTRFFLTFYIPRWKGERIGWVNLILTTFTQILQQDVEHKHAEVLASQKRLERYQLFVQHEVKNIAQFIQLLGEQVAIIHEDADKIRLADRLKQTLPAMTQRARTTIQQMKEPLNDFSSSSQVDLRTLIQEVLDMYRLNATLTGSDQVTIARPVLLEAFKNILGNYRDHGADQDDLRIHIDGRTERGVRVEIQSKSLQPTAILQPERLFEPFWTTSESGMGLGLFLTRELLKQVNSEIEFQQNSNELIFTLILNNVSDRPQ